MSKMRRNRKSKKRRVVAISFASIVLIPFFIFIFTKQTANAIPSDLAKLQDNRSFKLSSHSTMDLQDYRDLYNLPDSNHSFGFLQVVGQSIAVNSFAPDSSKGYIVAIHGYFDNAGILQNLIHWAVENRYTIVLPDLPGHGLSSGSRANISDFNIYKEVLLATLNTIPASDKKVHLIAHSTGCTPIIQLLAEEKKCWSGETILVAPLVRSAHWHISKLGSDIISPFKERTGRFFRNSSHDEAFKQFQRVEPLRMNSLPTGWFRALVKWNQEIESCNSFDDARVVTIQGTEDGTVDWKYNLKFLERKLPGFEKHTIAQGRHHLLNESTEYRSEVFEVIEATIN